eukprot:2260375-Prymnesium_polylepis.1
MITIIGKFSDTRYGWHAASASQDTTTTTRRASAAKAVIFQPAHANSRIQQISVQTLRHNE